MWFCLTSETVRQGTEPLFKYSGGEAVHKPLRDEPEILAKLQAIGCPVIVESAVAGGDIGKHQHLARPLISAFHRTIRDDAGEQRSEGRIYGSVAPDGILDVHPPEVFGLSTT